MTQYVYAARNAFRVRVPSDWLQTASSEFEAVFIAPPVENGPGSNVAITHALLKPGASLKTLSDAMRQMQEAEYPEYQIIEEGDFVGQHLRGFIRRYRWKNTQEDFAIIQFQVFYLASQVAVYVLTATRPEHTDLQDVESLDSEFLEIAHSFEVIPSTEAS
jgi:hypothetical protein